VAAATGKDVLVPAPHPPEFRRRAVELAREKTKPVAELAKDLRISESCLRNWMAQAEPSMAGIAPQIVILGGRQQEVRANRDQEEL
jgi:transposase-like protein